MASNLTVETLGDAVAHALGPRLVALVLYGSAARGTHVRGRSDVNTLLICDAADDALFDALAPVVQTWTKAGHPAPLIFTEREWRASADAFPIEYEDIRDAHRLLAGRDPWAGIRVDHAALRRQLEHELMGKLVQLRQAYAALGGGRAETSCRGDRRERPWLLHDAAGRVAAGEPTRAGEPRAAGRCGRAADRLRGR